MDLAFQQVLATTPASQGKFTLHFVELLTPEDAAELVSTAAPEATVTAFAVVAGAYKGVVSVRAASPQSLPELFDTEVAREAAALDESVEDEQDQSLKAELQSYSAVLRARRNLVAAVEVTTTAQEINDVRGLVWFVAPLGFAQGGVLVRPERRND